LFPSLSFPITDCCAHKFVDSNEDTSDDLSSKSQDGHMRFRPYIRGD
jgi:hypothetical protein